MERKEVSGYLYILIGSTLWGISSVVAKFLFNIGLPPSELVLIRLTLATITLFFILLLFYPKYLNISLQDLFYFLILGMVGVSGMQYTYYYTISQIHVGPAILLQYLQPVWVAIYASLFQKEPFSKVKTASLLMAVLGCYLVVGGYEINLLRLNKGGILSGVVSSLFFTFYALYGEKGLKRYNPWTLIFYGFGFGAAFYWIMISPIKFLKEGFSIGMWCAFIYIAIFSTLLPFGFYFKGIERIRATKASITATWEPVVAGFSAYLVLGEILYSLQVAGGIIVILAVVLLQLSREKMAPSSPIEIRQG